VDERGSVVKVSPQFSVAQSARQRNILRLKRANEKDWDTLSKYLPSDVSSFFPFGLEGPEDYHEVSVEWLSQLLEVLEMGCPVPSRPPFIFDTSDEALAHNSKYLEDCPVAKRDRIIRSLGDANRCEVLEAREEASNEQRDRHWRRWSCYLLDTGVDDDPFFDLVPNDGERLLLARGFVLHCRAFDFDRQGGVTTERARPVVSSSL
jgi:hypothetical protein